MEQKNKLTPMQEKAINHGKGNALVSASAGSGKTFVVIERIIRLIIEEGVGVDEILAVTFTKLAAQEMKDKLRSALTKKYLQEGDSRLKEQLDLVSSSDISTIHSFCSKLIKKYFYVLGVDYLSRVVDESEKKALEERAVSELFERLYDLHDEDFLSLIPSFSSGRTDSGLKSVVKSLYDYAESEGGIDKVEEKTLSTYKNAFTLIKREYKPELELTARVYGNLFGDLSEKFSEDLVRREYAEKLKNYCNELLLSTDYFDFFERNIGFSTTLPSGKSKQPDEQAQLKVVVDGFRNAIKEPIEVFSVSKTVREERVLSSEQTVKKLINLVRLYGEEYKKIKREENAVDFNDLEKLALALLQDQSVQSEVRNTYKYVFVDEYQDVNAVQEEIINLISKDNAFLVGDSKQSIYAFRGCNPSYFKQKYDRFTRGEGTAIPLDNNFRSAKNIIDAVNGIFSPIMKEDFGGTDYKNNPMVYGGGYLDFDGKAEIHQILKTEKEEIAEIERGVYSVKNSTESKKKAELSAEAKLVIKLAMDTLGKPYYDVKEKNETKRYKQVGFGDICILLRSVGGGSKLAEEIVTGLSSMGIPVTSSVKKTIESYPEIKVLVNLIKLLSCADRDVPLATVMIHLFGFSENELSTVRTLGGTGRDVSFYNCVHKVANEKSNLGSRVKKFLAWLDDKRLIAEFLSVQEVVNGIVKETGYLAKILASPYGKQRLKRIERFLSEGTVNGKALKVCEFESHLDSALEDMAVLESSGEDTVKVMTMHASKGLEYPVVIIAGTSKSFNTADRRGSVISMRDFGVAVKSYNQDNMTVSENTVRALLKRRLRKESAVEELRLFYVALTRAKCYLHVIVNGKDVKSQNDLTEANRMSDFLLNGTTPVTIYNPQDILLDDRLEGVTVAGAPRTESYINEIVNNLSYRYPYENEIEIPVKSSVSDVNSGGDEYYKRTDLFGDSSSEKGTAYHKFFELIDFYNYNGKSDLEYFVSQGLMSEGDASHIDVDKVGRVLSLKLFEDIKDHALYKERKFCQLVPASKLLSREVSGSVLIQGILDLVAVKGGEAVLIDYKISTIESDVDLVKAYKTQLELYGYALEKILGVKLKGKYIVNVLQEKVITV